MTVCNGGGTLASAICDTCINYTPDKSKRLGICSSKLGMLFECKKYDHGENVDQGCYWCVNRQNLAEQKVFVICETCLCEKQCRTLGCSKGYDPAQTPDPPKDRKETWLFEAKKFIDQMSSKEFEAFLLSCATIRTEKNG